MLFPPPREVVVGNIGQLLILVESRQRRKRFAFCLALIGLVGPPISQVLPDDAFERLSWVDAAPTVPQANLRRTEPLVAAQN